MLGTGQVSSKPRSLWSEGQKPAVRLVRVAIEVLVPYRHSSVSHFEGRFEGLGFLEFFSSFFLNMEIEYPNSSFINEAMGTRNVMHKIVLHIRKEIMHFCKKIFKENSFISQILKFPIFWYTSSLLPSPVKKVCILYYMPSLIS